MTEYTVRSGDTLVRIAQQFGFPDWRTIYHAPENAEFRRRRPNPDRIFPGDVLIIPGRETPAGGFETGRRHRFRLTSALASAGATLTVHVVDERGRPVDAADVKLVDAGALPAGAAQTVAGDALFEQLAPGTYTVSARKLGYLEERTEVTVTDADEVTLTLEPGWRADWDRADGPATMASARSMVLAAPNLPAGTPVTFTVSQVGAGPIGTVDATSDADGARAPWDDWFAAERVGARVHLAAGQAFPVVRFGFVVEVAGVRVTADDVLAYADQLEARIDAPHVIESAQPADYILYSPYGTRTGTTDANGVLHETELPPGGVSVVFVQQVLVPS